MLFWWAAVGLLFNHVIAQQNRAKQKSLQGARDFGHLQLAQLSMLQTLKGLRIPLCTSTGISII